MGGWDWSEDSRLLLARAREHQKELASILDRGAAGQLWSINERITGDGTYVYALSLSHKTLTAAKPIIADLANNLVHALDQLVAALARLSGHDRSRDIYFPWIVDDQKFSRALQKLAPVIGERSIQNILDLRERHRANLQHIQIVKELSNSGKHWELIPSEATISAIALNRPGQQPRIWDVAEGSFNGTYYEFCESAEPLRDVPFTIVVRLRFRGLAIDVAASPDAIFDIGFRYVGDIITAVCGEEYA